MNKLMASALAVGAVALAAQAETAIAPMENPSWGYVISGLGDSGREAAYVFTNTTAQMSWTAPLDVASAELLVVGGGGAGGFGTLEKAKGGWAMGGGGGGAGGFVHVDSRSITPGGTYRIVVGAGAASIDDKKGGNSSFDDLTAVGGGCGGYISKGFDGGSGGGGSCGPFNSLSDTKELTYDGGAAESEQGFGGGYGKNETKNSQVRYGSGGGGGGAGSAGADVPNNDCGGNGGAGLSCEITGEPVVYSAGGGGASDGAGNAAGEAGGVGAGRGGQGCAGEDATGYGCGGGGGVVLKDAQYVAGKGYQGVVVVRVNPTLNAWVEEPGLSATEWVVDQAPEDLAINFGRALHGEVTCNMTVDDLKALTMGNYDVVFTASADGYETIAKTNVVKVIAEAVEITLTNEDGSELDISTLSAGSVVKVNFTDNDNQDLVLSVAYGRYDKGYNFTTDPDTLDKAAGAGRDYDPEHFGGWDYFDPIVLIEAGQESYTYTIPVNFGIIYTKDWTGKEIPEKYKLPTDKIRFFLTPKSQTPMKYLKFISGTNPDTQYITTGILPSQWGQLVMIDVCKVSGGSGGFIIDTAKDKSPDPYLVYDISMTSAGVVKYNLRDSDKSPNPGTNSGLSPQCTLSATSNYRFQFQMDASNNRLRVAKPTTKSGTWDFTSARTTNLATADATGPVVFHGASVSINRLSASSDACYMIAAMGYNKDGELVPGLHDGIRHQFFPSEGGVDFVAGPEDQYQKDQMENVPVRGQTETMICHVHQWDMDNIEVIEAATCTKKGKGKVVCKVVGCPFPEAWLEVELDAIGHEWGEWVVEKPATCTEEGYEVRSCTRELCDHIGSPETNKIAKLPHQRIFVKEEGGKLYYSCAHCETELTPEIPQYGKLCHWLQSDGVGYITTDYKPSFLATKIVSDVAKWSNATTSCLYSDDITGTSGKYQLRIWTSGTISFYNWPYADDGQYPRSEAKFANVQVGSPFQHVAYQDRAIFRGETSEPGALEHWSEFTDATRRAGKPLVFFADLNSEDKDASKKVRYVATAKVRGFKVYEVAGTVETLVHDYVPATKDGKNAGLWDRVENKYWPATSAGFTAGKNLGLSIVIR